MKDPIKWALEISLKSKNHTDKYETPIATTVNMSFGIFTLISFFLSLISALLWLMADMSGALSSLRISLIITAALLITWGIVLRILEVYLDFHNSKTN